MKKFGNAITPGAIVVKNAQSSLRKLNGNKFKRKLAEARSFGNDHANGTFALANHSSSTGVVVGGDDVVVLRARGGEGGGGVGAAVSPTSCPPCDTEGAEGKVNAGNQTIGFVAEWISAYIFLARKFRTNHPIDSTIHTYG